MQHITAGGALECGSVHTKQLEMKTIENEKATSFSHLKELEEKINNYEKKMEMATINHAKELVEVISALEKKN